MQGGLWSAGGGTPPRSGTWLTRGVVGLQGFSAAAPEKGGNLQPLIGPNLFIPLPGDETRPKRLWPRGEVPHTPPRLLWEIGGGGSGEAALGCPAKNKTSSGFG